MGSSDTAVTTINPHAADCEDSSGADRAGRRREMPRGCLHRGRRSRARLGQCLVLLQQSQYRLWPETGGFKPNRSSFS